MPAASSTMHRSPIIKRSSKPGLAAWPIQTAMHSRSNCWNSHLKILCWYSSDQHFVSLLCIRTNSGNLKLGHLTYADEADLHFDASNQNWKCNLVTWSMQTKPNHASLVVSKLKCAPPDNGQKFSYKLLCKAMRPGISTRTTLCLPLSLCRWMLCRHNAHHNREVACKPPSKQEASS